MKCPHAHDTCCHFILTTALATKTQPFLSTFNMASITAKKNQAKLAESIYKQTHCKCKQVYYKLSDLKKQYEYMTSLNVSVY